LPECSGKGVCARRACMCREKGAVTLEAAVSLPVFICVIVAIAFLLRAVQVHDKIQHAISSAALEIAGISYVYGKSGALDIQRETGELVQRGVDKAGDAIKKSAKFEDPQQAGESGMMDDVLSSAASALTERANGVLFSLFAKSVAGKYLDAMPASSGANVRNENATQVAVTGGYFVDVANNSVARPAARGDALSGSNIAGGEAGLDFLRSSYLANESEDVIINVRYKFKIPIPIKPLSTLTMSQEACARAWLYGKGSAAVPEDPSQDEDDIWSLDNFARGRRIREIFHANLPDTFPGIASYSGGVATAIHSLDTTAASYQTPEGIGRKIDEYVRILANYAGQEKPYGKEGIVIPPEDITTRRLVLVIPRNEISPEISAEIDARIRGALDKGIILQVERYAKKKIESEENGDQGGLVQEVVNEGDPAE